MRKMKNVKRELQIYLKGTASKKDQRSKINKEKWKKLRILAKNTFHLNGNPYTVLEYFKEFILGDKP